jgi:hypothetical protein
MNTHLFIAYGALNRRNNLLNFQPLPDPFLEQLFVPPLFDQRRLGQLDPFLRRVPSRFISGCGNSVFEGGDRGGEGGDRGEEGEGRAVRGGDGDRLGRDWR